MTGRFATRSGLVCANFFWFVYKTALTLLSVYFQPNSLSSAVINSRRAQSAMTLENAGYHVDPGGRRSGSQGERRVLTSSCRGQYEWCGRVAFAGTRVGRRSWGSGGWYACRLPSDTAPHYLCWPGATRQLQLDRTRTIHPPASVLGLSWSALQRGDPSQIASDSAPAFFSRYFW